MDSLAFDQLVNDADSDINQENDDEKVNQLVELRKKAKLHEKAEHLLGRSFRNCVIHS